MCERSNKEKFLLQYQLEKVIDEPLRSSANLHYFKKGERICSQGDFISDLYILVEGQIKIYTNSLQGKTLILCFKDPVEVIGDIEYIQKKPVINTVEAVSDVCMLKIPYQAIDADGIHSVPLLQFLLKVITEKFYIDTSFTSFNMLHPVETRLASYLLSMYPLENNGTKQQVFFKTADLANLLGTSYRHINRVIKRFSQDQLIVREKGVITIVNRQRLKELAQSTDDIG